MFVSLNLLKIDILGGVEVDEYIANTDVFFEAEPVHKD